MGLFIASLIVSLGLIALAISFGFLLAIHVQNEILGGAREIFRLLYPLLHW